MNYYDLLQINQNASDEVIIAAHKALVKKYHPDNYINNYQAAKMIQDINVARDTLLDPVKRSNYNRLIQTDHQKHNRNETEASRPNYNTVNKPGEAASNNTSSNYNAHAYKTNNASSNNNNNAQVNYKTINPEVNRDSRSSKEDIEFPRIDKYKNEIIAGVLIFVILVLMSFSLILINSGALSNLKSGNGSENYYSNYSDIVEDTTQGNTTKLSPSVTMPPEKDIIRQKFGLSDTEEYVMSVMGTPDRIEDYNTAGSYWYYGDGYNASKISFSYDGIVTGWDNKGKLFVDIGNAESNAAPIKLGSDLNDVVDVMGTPDRIEDYNTAGSYWYYGDGYNASKISFSYGGIVTGWDNKGNLYIDIGSAESNAAPIKLGSDMNKVINAMGTPDRIEYYDTAGSYWYYGDDYNASKISFSSNGEVTGWEEKDYDLKLE